MMYHSLALIHIDMLKQTCAENSKIPNFLQETVTFKKVCKVVLFQLR